MHLRLATALLLAALALPAAPAAADDVAVPPVPGAITAPRLVARFRAHHVRAIDAVTWESGWRFYDGTLDQNYELLGSLTRQPGSRAWEARDHVGRTLGTIEPGREGWAIFDNHHAPIGVATEREIRCPNGQRRARHPRKGVQEIAMHAFFGPDAE